MKVDKINIEWNSSSHRINGDFHLNFSDKIMWFVRNFFDNALFSNYQVDILKFPQDVRIINKTLLDDANSPSRNLCNLFWSQLDISQILGKKQGESFNLLEIGCGNGRYSRILEAYGNKFKYTGIDTSPSEMWRSLASENHSSFFVDSSDNIKKYLDKVDVIITQSSLEHIEKDLLVFSEIKSYAEISGRRILSINLAPSPANLMIAPWHGIRQYGKRKIVKILKLIGKNNEARIYLLGGRHSTFLHFNEITWKSILGKQTSVGTDEYKNKMLKAFESDSKDNVRTNFRNATFVAFVLLFNSEQLEV